MSLFFNVSQLLKSEVGETRTYEFESSEVLHLDEISASGIHGNVKFTMTNFGIIATGHASADLKLLCARCLDTFHTRSNVTFEEEYRPEIDVVTGLPSTTPKSDTTFEISANHTIDLTEALRQHFLLGVEMVPVCADDCAGLCSVCGTNLNLSGGHTHTEEQHGPFAMLRDLLVEQTVETN